MLGNQLTLRKKLRFFGLSFLVLFLNSESLWAKPAGNPETEECRMVKSLVREGDLVFLDIPNFLFKKVAATSRGPTSHVGIVFKDPEKGWIVSESRVPLSTETPLCSYLERTDQKRFAVRRFRHTLYSWDITALKKIADHYQGIVYDTGFDLHSNRMFCSKFVRMVFEQGLDVKVGKLETFRELMNGLEGRPDRDELIQFWTYWYLGSIPMERMTVTPQSQYEDPQFFTIVDTF